MKTIEQFEAMYTSAYCRISFDVWYQGYKDHLSKHLPCDNLDAVFEAIASVTNESKLIRIDGVLCKEKCDMTKCMKAVLHFLAKNEQYSVAFALPYKEHKEADRLAYVLANKMIDQEKFYDELGKQDYLLEIWSSTGKSIRYLKIYEDATARYAIFEEASGEIRRGGVGIKQEVLERIYDWAGKIFQENVITEVCEGMSRTWDKRFQTHFCLKKLGLDDRDPWNIPEYSFDRVEGNGVLTELLTMPELEEFTREEVGSYVGLMSEPYSLGIGKEENEYFIECLQKPIPRPDGKLVCEQLRSIRREFARLNGIDYPFHECTYHGPCAGTCQVCDQEAKELREMAEKIGNVKYPEVKLEGS